MTSRRSAHSRRQQSVDIPKYPPQSAQAQASQNYSQLLQAPLPVSDYDSDNPGYISDYASRPSLANRTDAELNLSVLGRHNPEIKAILSIASYAVIYEFSPIPEPTWQKTGVEGTLFICQLSPGIFNEDRYHVIVLNRRGLDNFEAELREADDGGVEISDPYVIISTKDGHQQRIYGVFIFSEGNGSSTEQARAANAELMKRLAELAADSRKAAEAAASNAIEQHHKSHVQEAGETVPDQRSQVSLQELFGQNRREDAGYSLRAHNLDDAPHPEPQISPSVGYYHQPTPQMNNHPDVLGDLFRRAGLTQ